MGNVSPRARGLTENTHFDTSARGSGHDLSDSNTTTDGMSLRKGLHVLRRNLHGVHTFQSANADAQRSRPQIVKTARSVLFRKAFLDKALQITMRCRSSRLCPSSDFAQRKLGFSIGQNPEKARGNGNRLYCTRAFSLVVSLSSDRSFSFKCFASSAVIAKQCLATSRWKVMPSALRMRWANLEGFGRIELALPHCCGHATHIGGLMVYCIAACIPYCGMTPLCFNRT